MRQTLTDDFGGYTKIWIVRFLELKKRLANQWTGLYIVTDSTAYALHNRRGKKKSKSVKYLRYIDCTQPLGWFGET